MASRPGFPHGGPGFHQGKTSPPTAASISTTHINNILQNYQHEQVVYALMTQLREKETQMSQLGKDRQAMLRQQQMVEESNRQLKSKVDAHNKIVAEKDTKIAVLEQKLAQEKMKESKSTIVEAKLKHQTGINSEYKRILKERDIELLQLRPMLKDLKAKVDEFERNADAQIVARLEEELDSIKGELATAKDENLASTGSIEELEKKIKGKEWMIKSLREESNDQRSRENHLLAHIKTLKEKIETYETKFEGKGTDVPMLLAKLKDYEVRVKDLQGQVRRLTNKKLNELVVRAGTPVPTAAAPQEEGVAAKEPQSAPTVSMSLTNSRSKPLHDGEEDNDDDDNLSRTSGNSFSLAYEEDMEEDGTFVSNDGTETMLDDDQFYAKAMRDEDVLGEFLSDVKVGIETLEMESLCCAGPCAKEESRAPVSSPSAGGSYIIKTFTSGSRTSGSRSDI